MVWRRLPPVRNPFTCKSFHWQEAVTTGCGYFRPLCSRCVQSSEDLSVYLRASALYCLVTIQLLRVSKSLRTLGFTSRVFIGRLTPVCGSNSVYYSAVTHPNILRLFFIHGDHRLMFDCCRVFHSGEHLHQQWGHLKVA